MELESAFVSEFESAFDSAFESAFESVFESVFESTIGSQCSQSSCQLMWDDGGSAVELGGKLGGTLGNCRAALLPRCSTCCRCCDAPVTQQEQRQGSTENSCAVEDS